jgi:hypothetical protein
VEAASACRAWAWHERANRDDGLDAGDAEEPGESESGSCEAEIPSEHLRRHEHAAEEQWSRQGNERDWKVYEGEVQEREGITRIVYTSTTEAKEVGGDQSRKISRE